MRTKKCTKTLSGEAVRVSRRNIEKVALWCNGSTITHRHAAHIFMNLGVPHKQRIAAIGDYIIKIGDGLSAYFTAYTEDEYREEWVQEGK